jgi:hypothetical protein
MSARTCVECGLMYDLSQFDPRHNSQFESLPAMDKVRRQSRCRECNKIYSRRRALVGGRMAGLARGHGVIASARSGSVFRIVEVEGSGECSGALLELRQAAREFNASLPEDRCDVERHGITIESVPARTAWQTFLVEGGGFSP